jgi:tRNA uridine 5-carbamoylmethylation protein Kti12
LPGKPDYYIPHQLLASILEDFNNDKKRDKPFILSGVGGSGKTTLAEDILRMLHDTKKDIITWRLTADSVSGLEENLHEFALAVGLEEASLKELQPELRNTAIANYILAYLGSCAYYY